MERSNIFTRIIQGFAIAITLYSLTGAVYFSLRPGNIPNSFDTLALLLFINIINPFFLVAFFLCLVAHRRGTKDTLLRNTQPHKFIRILLWVQISLISLCAVMWLSIFTIQRISSLTTLVSSHNNSSLSKDAKGQPHNELNADEKAEIGLVLKKIFDNPESYNKEDHKRYWSIVGKLNPESIEKEKKLTFIMHRNSIQFWDDALVSIRIGSPHISLEREKIHEEIAQIDPEVARLIRNRDDEMMREIVINKRMITGGEEIYVNEDLIRMIIARVDRIGPQIKSTLEKLLTP